MQIRSLLLLSLLLAVAALTGHAGVTRAQGVRTAQPVAVKPAGVIEAKPIRDVAAPMSRVEGREAAEAALAGALIGIASEQFGSERITLRLQSIDMQPVSPRDRNATGNGQLRIGSDPDWLPFRYRALYDSETQTAGGASITLGSDDRGAISVARNDAVRAQLAQASSERMRREFPQQQVALALSEVRRIPAGRYQRYLAQGAAQFDRQPATPAQIEALYDPKQARWLRIHYELGEGADWLSHRGEATPAH